MDRGPYSVGKFDLGSIFYMTPEIDVLALVVYSVYLTITQWDLYMQEIPSRRVSCEVISLPIFAASCWSLH